MEASFVNHLVDERSFSCQMVRKKVLEKVLFCTHVVWEDDILFLLSLFSASFTQERKELMEEKLNSRQKMKTGGTRGH